MFEELFLLRLDADALRSPIHYVIAMKMTILHCFDFPLLLLLLPLLDMIVDYELPRCNAWADCSVCPRGWDLNENVPRDNSASTELVATYQSSP